MSSVNKNSFISFFPGCTPFISFSWSAALTKISSTILKRSGERGHPCILPDFTGSASGFSLLNMVLAIRGKTLLCNWCNLAISMVNTGGSQELDIIWGGLWLFQENHCIIPDVGLASSSYLFVQLPQLLHHWHTPKLPITRVFSSPSPANFWGEVHQGASSKVTFFSAHLACDKLTLLLTPSGKTAGLLYCSLTLLWHQDTQNKRNFSVYVWELPLSKGYMKICSMNIHQTILVPSVNHALFRKQPVEKMLISHSCRLPLIATHDLAWQEQSPFTLLTEVGNRGKTYHFTQDSLYKYTLFFITYQSLVFSYRPWRWEVTINNC